MARRISRIRLTADIADTVFEGLAFLLGTVPFAKEIVGSFSLANGFRQLVAKVVHTTNCVSDVAIAVEAFRGLVVNPNFPGRYSRQKE